MSVSLPQNGSWYRLNGDDLLVSNYCSIQFAAKHASFQSWSFFIAFVRREPISQFISGIITGIFIVDVSFIYWTKLKHVEVNVWLKFWYLFTGVINEVNNRKLHTSLMAESIRSLHLLINPTALKLKCIVVFLPKIFIGTKFNLIVSIPSDSCNTTTLASHIKQGASQEIKSLRLAF